MRPHLDGHKPRSASTIALLALAVGQFLVGLDLSVMSVALPSIQKEFSVGMLQLQWAVMAYMVAGAALAVVGVVVTARELRREAAGSATP